MQERKTEKQRKQNKELRRKCNVQIRSAIVLYLRVVRETGSAQGVKPPILPPNVRMVIVNAPDSDRWRLKFKLKLQIVFLLLRVD